MDQQRKSAVIPLFVAFLLILPLIYLGTYFANVIPGGVWRNPWSAEGMQYYRVGGRRAEFVYWPLERIDRQLRPSVWNRQPQMLVR